MVSSKASTSPVQDCGLPRRRLGHDSSRIGFFAARAWKFRLLPTEHAPWKNRGLGKGRLACWWTSPVSGDSCAWTPWHGSGGGNSIASLVFFLPFDLTDLSHQSQGCSVIRTQSLGGRDPVVVSACRATMGVKVLKTPFRVILRDRSARANPSPSSHGSLEWRLRRRLTSRPTLAK